MFKKIFTFFLVFSVFFTLLVKVSAQSQESPPIFTPFCFTASYCSLPETGCSGEGVPGHRAKLTVEPGKGPVPNSKVYVVTCLSSADGQHCTSGNSEIDTYLTYPPMPADFKYVFQGLFKQDGITPVNQTLANPLTTNAGGDLSVPIMEWQDASTGHNRIYIGISESQPEPTTDPNIGLGGQQLGEPVFDWAGALQKCIALAWDPDGRVFDSQSLEPVPGASVTLTKKRADGNFTYVSRFDPNDVPDGILTNPYMTVEDGYFSFIVTDGTYKLTPQISGYNFPGSLALNSNYSKIYSNIYPLLTGLEIVEKGAPQRRDIPIDSVTGLATYFPIKIMEYFYQSDRISSVFVDGRVSHPLATINAYSVIPDPNNPGSKIRYKLIKTVQADKFGRFSLIIDQSTFNKNNSEMFGEIEAIKANFGLSSKDTHPTPAILKLDPILTYIEGNAVYKNKVLPGAKVEIMLESSTKPYYETTADSQGYFKIPSDYIPFMPYKLRYSSGGVISSVTTSDLISDNSAFIKDNNINLFYPKYSNPKVNESIKKSITAYNNELKGNQNQSDFQGKGSGAGNNSQKTSTKNLAIYGLILLIVILLTGVGVLGVYLIKKKQSASTM